MSITFDARPALGFHTSRHGEGASAFFRYTLTTKLIEYLREAERRYGQRNMEWTLAGLEFYGTIPSVWFPGSEKAISIILTETAALNSGQALFQIAHEIVHLLEPSHLSATTVFEEGLATMFAHEMSVKDGLGLRATQASYLAAEQALKDLIAIYPEAVRLVRESEKTFFNLTKDGIFRACPKVPDDLATTLCQKFDRDPVVG